jgi:hypothetical protein
MQHIRLGADGKLDEISMQKPDHVHLEQMADDHWCLIITYDGKQLIIDLATSGEEPIRAVVTRDEEAS